MFRYVLHHKSALSFDCYCFDFKQHKTMFFSLKLLGVRVDNDLQDCNGTHWKKTFPDLDYALLGYDILHGDPMTECDPGFTHPIFRADYSEGRQSSDCRYSIPTGLTVYPCQSCVVSFESKLIRNKQEMSKHLGASANVEGKQILRVEIA